jgi:hypothetical protein
MNSLIITIDLDWACEPAVEETLDFLQNRGIRPTVFITHRSSRVESSLNEIDVGLHPFFDPGSSHGSTISKTVEYVMNLPHNLPAFRCHRYAICNASKQAMSAAGMFISSNVCTDLEIVKPFRDRFGMLEVPIFLEDGGYLWLKRSLDINESLSKTILEPGAKVITIHPMHFALNTPYFAYMSDIKQSMSREAWGSMSKSVLSTLRWKGQGIRDFLVELLQIQSTISSLRDIALHNPQKPQHE